MSNTDNLLVLSCLLSMFGYIGLWLGTKKKTWKSEEHSKFAATITTILAVFGVFVFVFEMAILFGFCETNIQTVAAMSFAVVVAGGIYLFFIKKVLNYGGLV